MPYAASSIFAKLIVCMALTPSLGALFMQGADTKKAGLGFKTLAKEQDGGPVKGGEIVIQTDTEWKDFVDRVQSESVKKKLLAEKVDFSKETVIVVAEKNASILGELYEPESGIQKVTSDQETLTVEYNTIHSDHLDTKPRYRFHAIKAPKCKKVAFKVSTKAYVG